VERVVRQWAGGGIPVQAPEVVQQCTVAGGRCGRYRGSQPMTPAGGGIMWRVAAGRQAGGIPGPSPTARMVVHVAECGITAEIIWQE